MLCFPDVIFGDFAGTTSYCRAITVVVVDVIGDAIVGASEVHAFEFKEVLHRAALRELNPHEEVRDKAVPLARWKVLQPSAARLWDRRCEQAVDFGIDVLSHFFGVMVDAPLESVVFAAPAVSRK